MKGMVAAVALVVMGVQAEARTVLGTFKNWDAIKAGTGNSTECFVASVPTRLQPASVNHGQVYATVAHKPPRKVRDEVNIVVGYQFKDNSNITVTTGGQNIGMFTAGRAAWADSPETDAKLVAAMKKGSQMTVKGSSARGTSTTYVFSLIGFSAAYNAINQACPG